MNDGAYTDGHAQRPVNKNTPSSSLSATLGELPRDPTFINQDQLISPDSCRTVVRVAIARVAHANVISQDKLETFWTRKAGPKKPLVVVLLVVLQISFPKILKAFLIRSGAQRNFANTLVLKFPRDPPSQIFKIV